MKRTLLFALALIAVFLGTVEAKGQEASLSSITSWRCEFPVQAFTDWASNSPDPEVSTQDITFHIDNVNLDQGSARLIGNAGSSNLRVTQSTLGTLHFLELTGGGLNVTSIFDSPSDPVPGRSAFKAVASRHQRVTSQNYGFCVSWE